LALEKEKKAVETEVCEFIYLAGWGKILRKASGLARSRE